MFHLNKHSTDLLFNKLIKYLKSTEIYEEILKIVREESTLKLFSMQQSPDYRF